MNGPARSTLRSRPAGKRAGIAIGLINNMGDEALKATERQFGSLVSEAAGGIDVSLRVFALKSTRRSARALDYINARYEPASAAMDGDLDGLIITGAQPQADRLSDEPYWEELAEVIDWAKLHTTSTILSCLAAHAGVLYLDGVERRPLPEKCTGVFGFKAERTHSLVGKQNRMRLVPHSRYNGLSRSELEQAGYVILTSSPECGVDSFVKSFGGYFEAKAEAELRAIERTAHGARCRTQINDLSVIDALAPAEPAWREAAIAFYRSWLEMLAHTDHRRCAPLNVVTDEYSSLRSI